MQFSNVDRGLNSSSTHNLIRSYDDDDDDDDRNNNNNNNNNNRRSINNNDENKEGDDMCDDDSKHIFVFHRFSWLYYWYLLGGTFLYGSMVIN